MSVVRNWFPPPSTPDPMRQAPAWALVMLEGAERKHKVIMMALKEIADQLEEAARRTTDARAASVSLFHKLSEQIAALAGNSTDQATMSRISSAAQAIKDNAQGWADAIVAGTPAEIKTDPVPDTLPQEADPTVPLGSEQPSGATRRMK